MAAHRRIIALLSLALLLTLAVACDSTGPATPTAISTDPGPGPTLPPEEAGVMPVRVVDRDLRKRYEMYDPMGTPFVLLTPVPAMDFEIEFTNLTGKDLAGFRGVLSFKDTAGNLIEGFNTEWILQEIKAGETKEIEYPIVDTEFIEARQKLKAQPLSDLVVVFKPMSVRLPDGTSGPYEEVIP
jgi:hypothetical protein